MARPDQPTAVSTQRRGEEEEDADAEGFQPARPASVRSGGHAVAHGLQQQHRGRPRSDQGQAAVRLGGDLAASVPFYGAVPPTEDIPKIRAAILAHHGELDTRLAASWPAYDAALTAVNVPHEGYIYPNSVHGFNCDATPERYNKAAADLAWQRTTDWFNKYLTA